MTTQRFLTVLFALALLAPLWGCANHKHCCGDGTRSAAPPAGCGNNSLPPGYIPSPAPVPMPQ